MLAIAVTGLFLPAIPVMHAGILSALQCTSLDALSELLGPDGSQALSDLQALWKLAEGYGYADWLVFDASVVRGLAYYTGERWGIKRVDLHHAVWPKPQVKGRHGPQTEALL
jgi:hypothetical protein